MIFSCYKKVQIFEYVCLNHKMKVKVGNISFLKKIIDTISKISANVNIECDENGLSLQTMDDTHVSLISLFLSKNFFDLFECTDKKTLGIDILQFQKILKCGIDYDSLTLKTDDQMTTLTFQFESSDQYFMFKMNLINYVGEKLTIPEVEPNATIKMPSKKIQKIFNDLHELGDYINISVNKDVATFSIITSGGSGFVRLDSSSYEVKSNCATLVELDVGLLYLNLIDNVSDISEKVVIKLTKDLPLLLDYELDNNFGYIRYYIAPRVSDEEEEE